MTTNSQGFSFASGKGDNRSFPSVWGLTTPFQAQLVGIPSLGRALVRIPSVKRHCLYFLSLCRCQDASSRSLGCFRYPQTCSVLLAPGTLKLTTSTWWLQKLFNSQALLSNSFSSTPFMDSLLKLKRISLKYSAVRKVRQKGMEEGKKSHINIHIVFDF